MVSFHSGFIEHHRNIQDYLRSLHLLRSNLDVQIWDKQRLSGSLIVRDGVAVGASCGNLQGNGALLTLGSLRRASLHAVAAENKVSANVDLSFSQLDSLLKNPALPELQGRRLSGNVMECGEDQLDLDRAVSLIYQLQRQFAAKKLIGLIVANRFCYPAWLWYSRLLTNSESLRKALHEALMWGNHDREILEEADKVSSCLGARQGLVKRCFFCWAPLEREESVCCHCGGLQGPGGLVDTAVVRSNLISNTLLRYEEQLAEYPSNVKVLYVLALGYLTLDDKSSCRKCLQGALQLMPKERMLLQLSKMV